MSFSWKFHSAKLNQNNSTRHVWKLSYRLLVLIKHRIWIKCTLIREKARQTIAIKKKSVYSLNDILSQWFVYLVCQFRHIGCLAGINGVFWIKGDNLSITSTIIQFCYFYRYVPSKADPFFRCPPLGNIDQTKYSTIFSL